MKQAEVILLDSNSAEFSVGRRVRLEEAGGTLSQIAGYSIETVTYSDLERRVYIRTELGYQFTITSDDYHRLIAR
ncbi:MAG: hypothetical protein ACJ8CR_12145 [Roseiflexaceae bacterium]